MALSDDDRISDILADLARAQDDAFAAVSALSAEGFRAPSRLPGWGRAHVVAHLATLATALAAQCDAAARGELVPLYEDGMAGRDRAIEEALTLSQAALTAALRSAFSRLDASWPATRDGWGRRVAYRSGTVVDVLYCWWREIRIHLADADVGAGFDGWPGGLYRHLVDFLRVRLPAGQTFELASADGAIRDAVEPVLATSPSVRITGTPASLVAWLAGRGGEQEPRATQDGAAVPLPSLGPWPSALRAAQTGEE